MQYTAHVRGMVHPVSEGFFSGEYENKEIPAARGAFAVQAQAVAGIAARDEHRSQTEVETWSAQPA